MDSRYHNQENMAEMYDEDTFWGSSFQTCNRWNRAWSAWQPSSSGVTILASGIYLTLRSISATHRVTQTRLGSGFGDWLINGPSFTFTQYETVHRPHTLSTLYGVKANFDATQNTHIRKDVCTLKATLYLIFRPPLSRNISTLASLSSDT